MKMGEENSFSVITADAQVLFRYGLRLVLENEGRLKIVGEASTAPQLIEIYQGNHAHIVIFSLNLPGMPVYRAVQQLIRQPSPPCLLLLADHYDLISASHWLKSGVHGYVHKSESKEILLRALAALQNGELFFPQPVFDYWRAQQTISHGRNDDLTSRELDVLALIGEGLTNKAISQSLNLQARTVRHHIQQIFEKCQIQTLSEAMILAYQFGLLTDVMKSPVGSR